MTEASLGSSFSWWIGKVVNVKDPDQSGRVQIRVFGKHDDTNNIPDKDLPWAMPLQPVTSPAIGKLGTAPLGLVKDSKVVGFWADSDQQYPIIMGSFGKAGDPKPGSSTDGAETIDIKTGSIPSAAVNQSDPVEYNAFSKLFPGRIDINKINSSGADPTVGKFTISTGIVNKTAVDSKLKEPTKPTTASADKTATTDILDLVKQVDPNKLSRALPGAVDGFNTVRNIMSLTSPVGLTNLLSGSLIKSITGLAGSIGVAGALGAMTGLIASGSLTGIAQNALKLAVADVTLTAALNGGSLPPIATALVVPQISAAIGSPVANLISTSIPPTYVQQYYPLESEPYPGYIHYKDVSTGQSLYKLRGPTDYHFASAQDHIQHEHSTIMEAQFGAALAGGAATALLGEGNAISSVANAISGGGAVAAVGNALGGLAGGAVGEVGSALGGLASGASALSGLSGAVGGLAGGIGNIASGLGGDAIAGLAGSVTGALSGITNMGIGSILGAGMNPLNMVANATKLLPNIGGNIQNLVNGALPKSALDIGKVGPAMSDFTKNQALLAQKKNAMNSALKPDIDSKLADAQKRLAASENAKNITGTSEVINGQRVTYTATGATISKV